MKERTLIAEIKKQLRSFSKSKDTPVEDTTVIQEAIMDDQTARRLFQGNVRWALKANNHTGGKWPSNFLSLTVQQLASKLMILLMFISLSASAQVDLNISAVKTELKKNALNFAFSYLNTLDSAWAEQDFMTFGKRSYLMVTPDVNIQSGTSDAFSSMVAKVSAIAVFFKTNTLTVEDETIQSVDADRLLHTLPINLGVETNNQLSFINVVAEAGYSPWFYSPLNSAPAWLKATRYGVYLQGGYKFKLDTTGVAETGGQVDQSAEAVGDAILRAKGSFRINSDPIISVSMLKIGVVGEADAWYDFLNGRVYHRLQGVLRLFLNAGTFVDLQYEHGSGAPNFNQGDQYGVGLTVKF